MKRYGESGQPCLVYNFSRIALSFSPFSLILAIALLRIGFNMFMYAPCSPSLANIFNMKLFGILLKFIHHLMRWPCDLFLSICTYGDYIDVFSYIEPPLYPWKEAYFDHGDDVF